MENFSKIFSGFIADFLRTFPEYETSIQSWWGEEESHHTFAFQHCLSAYPVHFFDILNKNETIFTGEFPLYFIPGIDFNIVWHLPDISENTKESMWKYLQAVLFSIVGNTTGSDFEGASSMLNTINEPEFKEKLETVMNSIQETTASVGVTGSAEDIHNHLSKFLDGKLGNLAKELADETASELDVDFEKMTDVNDVMQTLFKNPAKLMGLVTSISGKLESKIKTGELDQKEIMDEAAQFMENMKTMPGLENFNIHEMMSKLGMHSPSNAAAPTPPPTPSALQRTKSIKPKKAPVSLKEIQDQKQLLDNMMDDEELIALFKRPDRKKK